jgi:hypothetical protein
MNPYEGPDHADPGQGEHFGTDMITMNPPRWRRWRQGRTRPIAVAGVAIAALASGAGVGYAATHSVAASGSPGTAAVAAAASSGPSLNPVPPKPGRHANYWFSMGGVPAGPGFALGFGVAGAVHGQLTVPKSGGGYQNVDVQRGTVTAVSSASITVKSADGFTASYAVNSKTLVDAQAAGIGSVKKGDTVFVSATVSGSTATAANVFDITAVKAGRASFGFPARPSGLPGLPGAQVKGPAPSA